MMNEIDATDVVVVRSDIPISEVPAIIFDTVAIDD